jgi:hypothetical protein
VVEQRPAPPLLLPSVGSSTISGPALLLRVPLTDGSTYVEVSLQILRGFALGVRSLSDGTAALRGADELESANSERIMWRIDNSAASARCTAS